jgi:hypothetical protein
LGEFRKSPGDDMFGQIEIFTFTNNRKEILTVRSNPQERYTKAFQEHVEKVDTEAKKRSHAEILFEVMFAELDFVNALQSAATQPKDFFKNIFFHPYPKAALLVTYQQYLSPIQIEKLWDVFFSIEDPLQGGLPIYFQGLTSKTASDLFLMLIEKVTAGSFDEDKFKKIRNVCEKYQAAFYNVELQNEVLKKIHCLLAKRVSTLQNKCYAFLSESFFKNEKLFLKAREVGITKEVNSYASVIPQRLSDTFFGNKNNTFFYCGQKNKIIDKENTKKRNHIRCLLS